MKTLITLAATLFLVGSVHAQSTASESANITADVVAALSIAKTGDLAFGDVAQNTTSTVAVTDAAAVKFTVSGQPNKNVTFTLTAPNSLSFGTNSLPFTDDIQINTTDDASTASILNDADTTPIDGTGNLYVYLGGTVDATGATPGSYAATYIVQVDY